MSDGGTLHRELTLHLGTLMSEISEECWAAGWMSGIEQDLPRLAALAVATPQEPQSWGQGWITAEMATRLLWLAGQLGHWDVCDETCHTTAAHGRRGDLMALYARDGGGGDYELAPAGNHNAVCVDVVDLGLQKVPPGRFSPVEQIKHQVRFVWELDEEMEDGRRFSIGRTFNLTLHENGAMRPVLESWRGKAFTGEELQGFDVEKVLHAPCMLQVIHAPGAKAGSIYANVATVTPLPKGMAKLSPRDYQRSKRDSDMAAAGQALLNGQGAQAEEPTRADYDDQVIPF